MSLRNRRWVPVLVVVLLAVQAWNCAAYNNQQTKWLEKHLSRSNAVHASATDSGAAERRHLEESTTSTKLPSGWRSSLVDEEHRLHSQNNLSSCERIRRAAERSKSRAQYLDSVARTTPYRQQAHRRPGRKTLQSLQSPVAATPGSYSMALSLGTPAQNFVAIADTGSDLVWVQCASCSVCFDQATPPFQSDVSSTYAPLGCSTACSNLGGNQLQCTPNCQYTYSYGDQSTTAGDFSTDTVTLAGANGTATTRIPEFQFGCGLQNQGTFTETDGIVGLARGPISFISQIAPYLDNVRKFSHCLVSKYEDVNVTSPIIFGAAAVPTGVVTYTPLQTPYEASRVPFYYTNLLDVSVGGANLGIPVSAFQIDADGNGGTIFDSGTTYTFLATEAYTPILDAFASSLTAYVQVDLSNEAGLDLCYDISGIQSVRVPTLVFHFENGDFDLSFDNIFVRFSDTSGQTTFMCLALMETAGFNIFGNTQQQNFQVIYDEDNLQLGWVPADCKTL